MQFSYANSKQVNIPDWMLETDNIDSRKAGIARTGFLRRTLTGISKVLQNDLLAERFASRQGLLQGIDPRVKLLSILLFMIITGAAKSFATLIVLCIVSVMLVKLSRLGVFSYMKRVWLILPLFLLVLSMPAATNLIIEGRPLMYLYKGLDLKILFARLPQELYLSAEGIRAIVKMSLRIGVSISFGYLLVMTTRWSQLTKALAVLRVPKLAITILDMTYRYVFVLSRVSIEMFEARTLRTVGKIKNKDNRRFVANSIAYLFVKASYMSEEVYDSMLCRGYTGEPVSLTGFRLTRNDYIWIFNVIIIIMILVLLSIH